MRVEHDSMGDMLVPDAALYGASTQRAVLNFPVSGLTLPNALIRGLAMVKSACAAANADLKRLDPNKARLIQRIAQEIVAGELRSQFPIDVFQTGSGTSTNMNINEVIANRACQLAGRPLGSRTPIHPNDDVNLGQSSNDVMPTALHVSVALALRQQLHPALRHLRADLENRARAFETVVKAGRTHLMDATPVTLGQEFSGYATQVEKAEERTQKAVWALRELAIGGTAVGTGLNGHPEFAALVCRSLADQTGIAFIEARNHFEAQAARDDAVEAAGHLVTIAASLTKIANDLRLLASGPRCGLGEIRLPAIQPGSSMMPSKVNPVMCEMLVQVCLYTQGLAQIVALCGREGQLELNATIPLVAHSFHEVIRCLANGISVFANAGVHGIEADVARCAEFAQRSPMLVTALNPFIGYDRASAAVSETLSSGRPLREVLLEMKVMDAPDIDRALDLLAMTRQARTPPLLARAPSATPAGPG